MNEFFVVALPGLEDLVQAEISDWFPNLETRVDHGGVTVFAPMATGLSMNWALKTPTRILLRVAHFRCRDFPKLFQTVSKLPWKDWIHTSCELKVHVSTRLSRVKIKTRIEEACLDGWLAYKEKNPRTTVRGQEANLYVRFLNDECTLSLDTSGERLHKRGEREHVGTAPLRETIAAAMIQMAIRKITPTADEKIEIVDPMMGSGTFLLEAAGFGQLIEKRAFAFENFAIPPKETPLLRNALPQIHRLIGFESDKKTFATAEHNLAQVKNIAIDRHAEDFFKAEPLPPAEGRRWLFVNPPYGERLKVKEPLLEYYEKLFAAAERVTKPDVAYFLLPAKIVKGKFILPLSWKVIDKRPFVNGGIPVVAFGFARSHS